MNIYTVDYWIPFPSSEYGGLYVIAANTEEEIKEIAWSGVSEYEKKYFPNGIIDLKLTYKLIGVGNYEKPQIIDSFYT